MLLSDVVILALPLFWLQVVQTSSEVLVTVASIFTLLWLQVGHSAELLIALANADASRTPVRAISTSWVVVTKLAFL